MRTLLVALVCLCATACTFIYDRQYVAAPTEQLSPEETEAVFRAFDDLLRSKGFVPLHDGREHDPNRVAYGIGGSDAGSALRMDWREVLEVSYTGGTEFQLALFRIVHHRADFSEDYLRRFVAQAEAFILEASSKEVRLVPVERNGN